MNEKLVTRLVLLSSIPALLIMGFLFDFVVGSLQEQNVGGAGFEPLLVLLFPLFELLLVLGALLLFWFLVRRGGSDPWVSLPMAVIGLLVLFAPPLLFFLPVSNDLFALINYIAPGTYLFQSGALLGVVGLLSIWLK